MFTGPLLTPRRAQMYLQMAIYYKMWFSVLFYPISLLLLIEKLSRFQYQTSLNRSLHIAAFVFLLVTDVARYFVGTTGNLRRQVFHVTAFLFLSVCPMFPSILYFNFYSEHRVRFDTIVGACMVVLLTWETIVAVLVLRELLRQETTRFVRLREAVKEQRDNHVDNNNPMAVAC